MKSICGKYLVMTTILFIMFTSSRYVRAQNARATFVHGQDAVAGISNSAGVSITMAGGRATGNATGGDVIIQTSNAGASGTMLQSLSTKLILKVTGLVGINTTSPTTYLDANSPVLRLRIARTPASAAAAGNIGDIQWDTNYIYICVGSNTWKRTGMLQTW